MAAEAGPRSRVAPPFPFLEVAPMARSSDSDQREHPRFRLEPGCAGVTVQRVEGMALHTLDGHAYDISISGARK